MPPPKAATRPTLSPAMERGRPPFPEGGHALDEVLAGPGAREGGGHVEVTDEVALEPVQHELVAGDGERREGGDLLGPGQRVVQPAHPMHESEPVGGLAVAG